MFSVNSDVWRVNFFLSDLEKRQLPFASALAVNRTARDVRNRQKDEMRSVFDRPTPYALNSIEIRPLATKADPTAKVWLKYFAGKGVPAEKFLMPEIDGGVRHLKRFERALVHCGVMPGNCFAVPGKSAKLDAYGNMDRGQLVQILSYFRAFPEMGYRANMSDRRREKLARGSKGKRGFVYVAVTRAQGRRRPGIYQRMAGGRNWKCVLKFVRTPAYSKRFDFFGVAQKTCDDVFKRHLDEALEFAVQTARR